MEKKVLAIYFLLSVFLPSACNADDGGKYVYWTGETAQQLECLGKAGADYKTQNGEIWIKEKDAKKAVMFCS